MIDHFIGDLSNTIVVILATFMFAGVCFKRKDLIPWLMSYITGSLSEIFRLFSQTLYDTYEIISILFSAFTVLIFVIAVSYEYYQTFSKRSMIQLIPTFFLLMQQQITSLGLQIFIAILLVISIYLIVKVYSKKRTPTHAFMGFVLVSGLLQVITATFRDLGSPGAEDFLEFARTVMYITMLITVIVAVIEIRIVESEKRFRLAYSRAEFYKDLFVHDINNILQNLEFSLEIIAKEADRPSVEKKITEIVTLAKKQVNRGAELGLNVRKLSDLESRKIKNTTINLNEILKEAVDYVKTKFLDKIININIDSSAQSPEVYANKFLSDVFRIILNNAVQYNDNSEIEILIQISKYNEGDGNFIKIEFIDNGIGIPEKMKKSLFYKIDEKPRSYKRIGLGLLLVREVVHSLNGMIWAEDRIKGDYKKGTNIILLIPGIQ